VTSSGSSDDTTCRFPDPSVVSAREDPTSSQLKVSCTTSLPVSPLSLPIADPTAFPAHVSHAADASRAANRGATPRRGAERIAK